MLKRSAQLIRLQRSAFVGIFGFLLAAVLPTLALAYQGRITKGEILSCTERSCLRLSSELMDVDSTGRVYAADHMRIEILSLEGRVTSSIDAKNVAALLDLDLITWDSSNKDQRGGSLDLRSQ